MRASILEEILSHKRTELRRAMVARPIDVIEQQAASAPPPRGFTAALRRGPGQPVRAIAEIKRASPSAGPIRPDADPAEIARAYQDAGAAALSILTDERYFDGRLRFLPLARAVVDLPVLRKDFVLEPYQVVEARAFGADAVLLIVAALTDRALARLIAEAARMGMDALVEVHDRVEAERALAAGVRLLGVNHRDLRTFQLDLGLTRRIAPLCPPDVVLVAESGVRFADDVRRLGEAGAHAVLVGEALMRAPSPGAALSALLEGA